MEVNQEKSGHCILQCKEEKAMKEIKKRKTCGILAGYIYIVVNVNILFIIILYNDIFAFFHKKNI